MKPLTKREKILLYLLSIVAIIAGIVVLVMQPAMTKSDALDEAILEKQLSVDSIRTALLTQQSMKSEIESTEAGIAEESTFFFPVMTNNELDEYITGLLQTHGLTALSLAIATEEEATAEGAEAQPANSDIRRYNIQTTARGTMRQFMLLVDTVKALDGIRIASIVNKQDQSTVPAPTPTPKPNRRETPVPILTTPAPTPAEGTYTMDILFSVMEYTNGTSTSVTLDREE